MGKPNDLLQGTLDVLILKTLLPEAKHGWAIAKRIQQMSGEVLQVQQGSLYPGAAQAGAAGLDHCIRAGANLKGSMYGLKPVPFNPAHSKHSHMC